MDTMMITSENMSDYRELLSYDEAFGIIDGKMTCFVALSEEEDDEYDYEPEPVGLMTAQIFHDFIKLKNIFVDPEYRRKKYASNLLKIIKKRPKNYKLPIAAFFEEDPETAAFFKKSGFKKQDYHYSVVEGKLGDMNELSPMNKLKNEYKLLTIDQLNKGTLEQYITKAPHEELIQFYDDLLDIDRFTDTSLVCMKNGTIQAVVLLEDFEDHTQISWMHGKDQLAIYLSLSMVKKVLELEYDPDYTIKCLCANDTAQKTYSKLFSKCEVKNIQMYICE